MKVCLTTYTSRHSHFILLEKCFTLASPLSFLIFPLFSLICFIDPSLLCLSEVYRIREAFILGCDNHDMLRRCCYYCRLCYFNGKKKSSVLAVFILDLFFVSFSVYVLQSSLLSHDSLASVSPIFFYCYLNYYFGCTHHIHFLSVRVTATATSSYSSSCSLFFLIFFT